MMARQKVSARVYLVVIKDPTPFLGDYSHLTTKHNNVKRPVWLHLEPSVTIIAATINYATLLQDIFICLLI